MQHRRAVGGKGTRRSANKPSHHEIAASGISSFDPPALKTWKQASAREQQPWAELFKPEAFNEQSVRDTVLGGTYPAARVHFVRGAVEQTIPANLPADGIALLRLDTDWYEPTHHELEHLYPLLQPGGVLIIEDYGHWDGARRAVDGYFAANAPLLLHRIDYTGRLAIKH